MPVSRHLPQSSMAFAIRRSAMASEAGPISSTVAAEAGTTVERAFLTLTALGEGHDPRVVAAHLGCALREVEALADALADFGLLQKPVFVPMDLSATARAPREGEA